MKNEELDEASEVKNITKDRDLNEAVENENLDEVLNEDKTEILSENEASNIMKSE